MSLAMSAWLAAGRLRGRRRYVKDHPERRRELVRRLCAGRSFVDVGGMWNVHGEVAFLAESAGAERVVLFDAMEATEEFRRERESRGSRVEFVRGDLHDGGAIAALGEFDVVWCSGVVYHSPNPFEQVRHLRRLCRGDLLLSSQVIPEVPGIEGACVWYPGLGDAARAAFRRAHGGDESPRRIGVTEPFDPALGYANYFWGISPSAMRGMVESAGFEVVDEYPWTTWLHDVHARPRSGFAP
jgi:hypothetical protein